MTKRELYEKYLKEDIQDALDTGSCWSCTEGKYEKTDQPNILVCKSCGSRLHLFKFKDWNRWRLVQYQSAVQRQRDNLKELNDEIRRLRKEKKEVRAEMEEARQKVREWKEMK